MDYYSIRFAVQEDDFIKLKFEKAKHIYKMLKVKKWFPCVTKKFHEHPCVGCSSCDNTYAMYHKIRPGNKRMFLEFTRYFPNNTFCLIITHCFHSNIYILRGKAGKVITEFYEKTECIQLAEGVKYRNLFRPDQVYVKNEISSLFYDL